MDTDLRRRTAERHSSGTQKTAQPEIEKEVESAEEDNNVEKLENELEDSLAQPKDSDLETVLEKRGFSSRARNWIVRFVFTVAMIAAFSFVVRLGPLWLIMLIVVIQVRCFYEIINIGYVIYKTHDLPWFRSLSWYFLVASNYFYYGEHIIDYFGVFVRKTDFLQPLVSYHRLISFGLYCAGIVLFVLSLRKHYYFRQFSMFAWTHITLLIVNSAAYFFVQNIFQGLIWFLVPVSLIICNDIMAYMFGFFFGKTPLIKLSPKKTWEGFIGGGLSTVVFGIMVSYMLIQYPYFTCPVEYNQEDTVRPKVDCSPHFAFQLQQYGLPNVFHLLGMKHVTVYPFIWHSIAMSLFASVIGPFGGFFASGFKRAFKIKDFAELIPGHGGVMDRFDCQVLMACFVNVYIRSFIRLANPHRLFSQAMRMEAVDQLILFNSLKNYLVQNGLLHGEHAAVILDQPHVIT